MTTLHVPAFAACYMYVMVGHNGNVKKCAVGKHPKTEKLGSAGQAACCETGLCLHPLPGLHRRQPQRVARIDPDAVVIDNGSYNKVTVEGAAANRVFFHLKAEAVRMGE